MGNHVLPRIWFHTPAVTAALLLAASTAWSSFGVEEARDFLITGRFGDELSLTPDEMPAWLRASDELGVRRQIPTPLRHLPRAARLSKRGRWADSSD